jgi:hypothetical protein
MLDKLGFLIKKQWCENYEIFRPFIGEKIKVSLRLWLKKEREKGKKSFICTKQLKKGKLNYGHKSVF